MTSVRSEVEALKAAQRDRQLHDRLTTGKVLDGPFLHLQYNDTKAFCSALYPKLLGTYEAEIYPHLESLLTRKPQRVVDVGAADGYYAVGLAKRLPEAEIIAYEQSDRACSELAKLCRSNGVEVRIQIKGTCSTQGLLELPRRRSLLIVDCEGAEAEILTPSVIEHFADSDFIIETHDGFRPRVTDKLQAAFAATHKVHVVEAIHDLDRPKKFPILDQYALSEQEKVALLRESRMHACLRWLVCYSLQP